MKTVVVLIGCGVAVAWLLSSKNSNAAVNVISKTKPNSNTPKATPSTSTTQKPSESKTVPTIIKHEVEPENTSSTLSRDETITLESGTDNDLYREGMASRHRAYVSALAEMLAEHGDTRAMDLTLRVANWGR